MTWWKQLQPAYKALTAILGAIAIGMGVMSYTIGGMAQDNSRKIDINSSRIERIEVVLDTLQSDMTLVRCWARAEIQSTDAKNCLFSH